MVTLMWVLGIVVVWIFLGFFTVWAHARHGRRLKSKFPDVKEEYVEEMDSDDVAWTVALWPIAIPFIIAMYFEYRKKLPEPDRKGRFVKWLTSMEK